MKRKVYVETSVISYLTARPSKTIVGAAHQQLTRAWWMQRSEYELLVSPAVWKECAAGDPEAALYTDASEEQLITLLRLTERYCVVYQTLAQPSAITISRRSV